jgi:hypothetical protein
VCSDKVDGFGAEECTSTLTASGAFCDLTCPAGTVSSYKNFAQCGVDGTWKLHSSCQLGEGHLAELAPAKAAFAGQHSINHDTATVHVADDAYCTSLPRLLCTAVGVSVCAATLPCFHDMQAGQLQLHKCCTVLCYAMHTTSWTRTI